tara:strand:+ start:4268 stop:9370 length:5103 start_codon:yes stop_codon:yes gene_type:complete
MALVENTQLDEGSSVNLEDMQKNIQQVGPASISQDELISNLNMNNRPPQEVDVAQAETIVPATVTDADPERGTGSVRTMTNKGNIPTLEDRTKAYDIRPEIDAAETGMLIERLKYEFVLNKRTGDLYRDYGSFESSINLEDEGVETTVNSDGEILYSGVYNTIRTNPAIVGQHNATATSYTLPDNLTRLEIIEAASNINTGVRNSGDLTFDPERDFFKKGGLLSVKLAEETTTVQLLRGIVDASPMAILAANSKVWNKVMGTKPSLQKLGVKALTGIPATALGYYLLGEVMKNYGDTPETISQQGWVSALYDLQEAELEFRNSVVGKQLGFEYDPEQINKGGGVRTLTKEQYAALLDPPFADYYVKLANSLTENVASVLSFGYLGGAMKISRWNTESINVLRKQATDNVENRSKARVAKGFKPLSFDPTTKEGKANLSREMGSIIDRELNDMKNQVYGGVFRFIYGFNKTQIKQQLENSPRYWFEVGAGESVGSGLQSLAAYYSWGSDRTQSIDKLPWIIAGGVFGPWTVSKAMTKTFGAGKLNPVKLATDLFRVVGQDTEGYARSMLAKTSYLSYIDQDPKAIPVFVDFLQGKTGTGTLPLGLSNDQREGLIKLKEQFGLIDDDMSGGLLLSMQTGLEQAQKAKEIAAKYGIELNVEETIGTFVKLQVIQGLEKHLVSTTIKGNKADIRDYNRAREDLLTLRAQALSETNALLDKVLRVTEEGGQDVALNKLIDGLQSELVEMQKAGAQRTEIVNMVFGVQVQDALRSLQKNPYDDSKIQRVKTLLESDMGKELKLSFEDMDLTTEGTIDAIDRIIADSLGSAYNQALNGRRAANLIKGGDDAVVNFETGETINNALKNKEKTLQGNVLLSKAKAQEVSGNFFAGNMVGRMRSVKNKVDRMYTKIFKGADAEQDVSTLYLDVTDALANIDPAAYTGTQNIARANVSQFFNAALQDGTRKYYKSIGGGDAAEGKKVLSNLLKDKSVQAMFKENGIALNAQTLNDPDALARVMLSQREIPNAGTQQDFLINMFQDAGIDPYSLKMPTLEFRQGFNNIKTEFFSLNIGSQAGKNTSKDYINQRTLGDVVSVIETKIDEIIDRVSEEPGMADLIESTKNYYKTNILDAKNSAMWKRTMGKADKNDTTSITGFTHGENSPQAWIRNELKGVIDDASATDFWNNFEKIFGTDPTSPYYVNALKSIDDTLMQDMAGKQYTYTAPFPAKFSGEKLSSKEAGALIDKSIVKEGDDVLQESESLIQAVKTTSGVHRLLEQSSGGKFNRGQTIDVYNKLKVAAETSKEARKEIIASLDRVDNLKKGYDVEIKSVQAGISEVDKFLTKELQTVLGVADKNFVGVTDLFITQPRILESTRMHLINKYSDEGMEYEAAVAETDRIIKHIVAKGISKKFQSSQTQMVDVKSKIEGGKDQITGMKESSNVTNVMEMDKYFDENITVLKELLGEAHYNDIKFITNYMAVNGYTTEVDAAAKFKLTEGYQPQTRGNMRYNPASIISRLYAAESGRTSYRYIGAEAVAAMMVNSKNDVLGALFTNASWSKGVKEFLADPKMPSSYATQKRIVWLEEVAAYSSIIGEGVKNLVYAPFSEDRGLLTKDDYLKEKLGIDTSKRVDYGKKKIRESYEVNGETKTRMVDGKSEVEIGDEISSRRELTDVEELGRKASSLKDRIQNFKISMPKYLTDYFRKQVD